MKLLDTWDQLAEFGIVYLTSESCGYMFRSLCDVTARGKRSIEQCLDCELVLHENWNTGSESDPHIGSIMLSSHMFPPLAAFAFLEAGFAEVWVLKSGAVVGIAADEPPDELTIWRSFCDGQVDRILRSTSAPRNQHQMTGRTV
jgi:hypothetical protein